MSQLSVLLTDAEEALQGHHGHAFALTSRERAHVLAIEAVDLADFVEQLSALTPPTSPNSKRETRC